MVDRVFGNLDEEATIEAFKRYLKDAKKWKIKALRNSPGVSSHSMDGQPNNGTPHDPDMKFVNHADAIYRYHERVQCCKKLKTVGEEEEILGDILLCRFVKGWSPAKTLLYINKQYHEYLGQDDRKLRKMQRKALWEGAMACPDDSVRIEKGD